ncbi:MAG: hypothetical protein VX733_09520 [Candidatus Latescibacterota bacterium]|nr:hypothetical protein [Candidatus Latescibacterota bacterium]
MEPISTFYLTPGGSSERIFLYYATISVQHRPGAGGGLEHEGGDIEIVGMALEML